jgi:hypothetical protein
MEKLVKEKYPGIIQVVLLKNHYFYPVLYAVNQPEEEYKLPHSG